MATQVKGILSNYTIMERYLGIEQPEDENERMLIETVSKHPVLVQYSILAELKERADNQDEIAAMVLKQIEAQGIPGMPGRPKEPTSPEQLTGTQSPTGQPIPQAEGLPPPGQSEEEQMERMATASPGMVSGEVK